MAEPTITLHIIAKDEAKQLDKIISKYSKYFNAVDIAIDDEKIYKEFSFIYQNNKKIKIYKYEWCDDFAHKRNWLVDKCETDYYMYIDTDDEIVNPEAISPLLKKAGKEELSVIYCFYNYSRDEWGNINAAHYKERILKNSPNLYWNKPIHENVLPRNRIGFKLHLDDVLQVKHNITFDDTLKSHERNIKYLIREYNRDKEKTDVRTIAYLGRTFFSFGKFKEAKFFLEKHIRSSGWDEDRYLSWCQLAEIYRQEGDLNQATGAAFEALQEKPDFPDAYFKLHDIEMDKERWDKSIEWCLMGFRKPVPKTFMLLDISNYTWRPQLSLSFAYFQMADFEKAMKLFLEAKRQAPTSEFIKKHEKIYREALEHHTAVKNLIEYARFVHFKNPKALERLIETIPNEIHEHDMVIKLKNAFLPPKDWSDKSAVIFCGESAEPWCPKNMEKGIGGSEEAVIHLSRELVKLGHEVTVYSNCIGMEGIYDGVNYVHYVKFNPHDHFNIIISWRQNIFEFDVQGKQKIMWLHDLPSHIHFDEDTIRTFDKIVVLSQYHASTLPEIVPKEKVFISTNGINPEDFVGLETTKRKPHRIIYASSYNRGLEDMLKMWPDIRKEVPDAEIHIYYGWDVYDRFVSHGFIKDDGFKNRMLNLMRQEGVYEHGRIGHKELLKEYVKSGIFGYYCTYAGEINCIALTKAIACGCYPMTNDRYALGERNTVAVKDKEFKKGLVDALKKRIFDTSTEYKQKYISDNSWESVARQWHTELFSIPMPTVIEDRVEWTRKQVHPHDKVVDIGCAEGVLFNREYKREGVTHVDLDKHKLPNFVQADARDLPFEDKSYDVATVGEMLEHFKDPIAPLKEAMRVAKKIILTVPYEHEWRLSLDPCMTIEQKEQKTKRTRKELLEQQGKIKLRDYHKEDGYDHLWHHHFFTPDNLDKVIRDAGGKNFTIVKIRNGSWSHLGAIISER